MYITPDIAKKISFQSTLNPENDIIKIIETKIFIAAINGRKSTGQLNIRRQIASLFPEFEDNSTEVYDIQEEILKDFRTIGFETEFFDGEPSISWEKNEKL